MLSIIGIATSLFAAFATATPAQAQHPHPATQDVVPPGQVLTAPDRPANADSLAGLAAVSPSIYPATSVWYVPPGGTYNCAGGNACAAVWDPTRNEYKVFYLFYCRTYALSNWYGQGSVKNLQTGGARMVLLDANRNYLTSYPADGVLKTVWDWGPVYYIKNC